MPTRSLKIWCNHKLNDSGAQLLRQGASNHKVHISTRPTTSNLAAGEADPSLDEADVAFGQPNADSAMKAAGLKWIHLTSAGYTRYDRDDFREALRSRGAALTNSSHVYDEPCAQHVLAMMLGLARQLPQALDVQRSDRSWPSKSLRANSHLLIGQSALLLGYGAIARRLTELLAPFWMRITAVRRRPTGDEPITIIPPDELPRALGEADHVINLLPDSPGTRRFVTGEHFSGMKRSGIFYNVGRGSTVDQDALRIALESRHLRAAYLDVTTPEPLPADDPLWRAPNCYITPHTAGGHSDESRRLIEHFLGNLRRYERGEALVDRVI